MSNPKVVVIGGGPGGYPAAIKAARLGAEVTLLEKREVGGTCLHRGCIPTKFMLKAAKEYALHVKMTAKGGSHPVPPMELSSIVDHRNKIIGDLAKGTRSLLQRNKVKVVQGTGSFKNPRTVRVLETGEEICCSACIIATGSENLWPPIEGKDLPGVLDSDRILSIDTLPKSLAIVGGGAIGLEFAQIFRRFGTEVSILELLPRILPYEDEDVSQLMHRVLGNSGIKIFASARVQGISKSDGDLNILVQQGQENKEISAERVLVAAGRRPFHDGLGLREIGLELPSGAPLRVNAYLETTLPGIYAIGDVAGGQMLAHKATAEGEVAACNAMGLRKEMKYSVIPRVVYTEPEVASVGLMEAEAREKYGNGLLVGRFPFAASGRAMIEGSSQGFVKVLAEPGMECIVGASIVGPQAGHLIGELALAIQMQATLEDVAATVHAHPTLSEAVREAALDAKGEAVHIPPRRR